MTIAGVDVIAAAPLRAGIGDIRRFPTARRLVGTSGCTPPSASRATRRRRTVGRPRKGPPPAAARHVLVEAAWSAARTPGPLRAFAQRIAARRGKPVAAVAVARKLAMLAWHLLARGEDYAFQRPATVARKLRLLELAAGAPRRKSGPKSDGQPASRAPTVQHQ